MLLQSAGTIPEIATGDRLLPVLSHFMVFIPGPIITGTHRKEAGSAAEEMVTPHRRGWLKSPELMSFLRAGLRAEP